MQLFMQILSNKLHAKPNVGEIIPHLKSIYYTETETSGSDMAILYVGSDKTV